MTIPTQQDTEIPYTIFGSEKLASYLEENKNKIDLLLKEKGAILLRGFKTKALSEFQKISELICNELFDYTYRSSPRTKLGGKIYTSTEYPKEYEIPQHNENSYSLSWPEKIIFHCVIEPAFQGETPIANSAHVYKLIHSEIREEFEKKKIMYVRNYRQGIDLDWREVFQTQSKHDVENYCTSHSINFEWANEDALRTRQVCQAIIIHPDTKEPLWFNQAHLFHESANPPDVRNYFLENFKQDEMPRNTFFGDGSPISEEKLNHIREAYKKAEITFPWKKGDTLILDNRRYSHGRKPFNGARKIIVALGN